MQESSRQSRSRYWLSRRVSPIAIVAGAALLAAASFETTSSAQALRPLDKTALRKIVETTAKELLVPGAVVILRTPIGDFSTAFGTTIFDGTAPVSADQHIRVGSNTKTWIGTVILQQVQEGLLNLDDPVSKFRSDVPNGNNITITHLLNMRSGLFNYSETPSSASYSTGSRSRSGRRMNCSRSRSSTRHTFNLARVFTIRTPTPCCSD